MTKKDKAVTRAKHDGLTTGCEQGYDAVGGVKATRRVRVYLRVLARLSRLCIWKTFASPKSHGCSLEIVQGNFVREDTVQALLADGQKAIRFDIILWIFDTYAPTSVGRVFAIQLGQQIICCGSVAGSDASVEDTDIGAPRISAVYRLSGQGPFVRTIVVQFDDFQELSNSRLPPCTTGAPRMIVEAGIVLLTSGCGQGNSCVAVVEVVNDDAGDISTGRLSGSLAVEPFVGGVTLVQGLLLAYVVEDEVAIAGPVIILGSIVPPRERLCIAKRIPR